MVQSFETVTTSAPAGSSDSTTETGLGQALARRAKPAASFWTRAWRRFRMDKVAMTALGVTILIIIFTVGAPVVSLLTGFTYQENHLADKLASPFTNHYVLGSDGNGRDILTRLAYGGRVSLLFAAFGSIATLVIGSTLGAVAGFFGGWIDNVIMRVVDVLLSIPALVLLILIASFYRPTVIVLAVFIALIIWPGVARLVRGSVLALRSRDFVDAARVIGATDRSIIFRHIMPNVVPIVIVWLSLVVPGLILTETSLSYLGVGIQAPTPSWGNMLQEAQATFRLSWTSVFIPGLMIFITALSMNLIGNGLRDAVDPRLNQ